MFFEPTTQKGTLFPLSFTLSLIAGICVYFALLFEPPVVCCLSCLLAGLVWFLSRKSMWGFLIGGCLFWGCLGFSLITLRTGYLKTPQLDEPVFSASFSGEVIRVRPALEGQKITLKNVVAEDLPFVPAYVRVNADATFPAVQVGDKISGEAHFIPPALPAQKGAYFFRRQAYFERLSAVGKLISVRKIEKGVGQESAIERVRTFIADRVRQKMPPRTASIAVPLIIGEQGYVPQDLYHVYKLAGITHALSVSGFHLAMIAGFIFFLIRGLFSLLMLAGIYLPVKKIAALVSLAVITGYLLISGQEIPTIRSYIMIAIVLGAVLFDRQALSLRSVALACLGILLAFPESVLSVSFQLSFMAVLSLVCLYTVLNEKFLKDKDAGVVKKVVLALIGMGLVSMCATLGTFPFVIHHFNQIGPYSVLGNMITGFLFSLLIMPALLFAVLVMPFGGDGIFLYLAHIGLDLVERMCFYILRLPYNYLTLPDFPVSALLVSVVGLLVLMLGKGKYRLIGIGIFAVSLSGFWWAEKPDILIAGDGKTVAVRQADGSLILSDGQKSRFITDTWLRKNGQNPDDYVGEKLPGLSVKHGGKKVAFSSLDCQRAAATFIVLEKYQRGSCPQPVIDKRTLRFYGTHTVFFKGDDVVIKNVVRDLGIRPWVKYDYMVPTKGFL